jgi:hypothetical protein
MGNQTNTINNVELFHGEAKNAVNKGFLEAFAVSQGSERLNYTEQMRSQKLDLREDEKDKAHRSKAGQAVKKEGLTKIEPFLNKIISTNYRKEQS